MELRYRFLRWFDVIAVLCLAVLPDFFRAIIVVTTRSEGPSYSFAYMHGAYLVRSLQVSAPILLIMLLCKVNWRQYGFRRLRPFRDSATVIGLIVASYVGFALVYGALLQVGPDDRAGIDRTEAMIGRMSPTTSVAVVIMVCSSIANGFAEELALRAYLIPRLVELSGSKATAVVVTSLLFGTYHIYQGIHAATATVVIGIVFGAYFVAKRRLWPIAAAHAAMDVLPQLYYMSA